MEVHSTWVEGVKQRLIKTTTLLSLYNIQPSSKALAYDKNKGQIVREEAIVNEETHPYTGLFFKDRNVVVIK